MKTYTTQIDISVEVAASSPGKAHEKVKAVLSDLEDHLRVVLQGTDIKGKGIRQWAKPEEVWTGGGHNNDLT